MDVRQCGANGPHAGPRSAACARTLLRAVTVCALLAMLALAPAHHAYAGPPYFAGVVLEDPGGKEWPLDALREHATLLVIADRAASEDALAWGKGAGEARLASIAHWAEVGKLVVVSILDLRAVPSFARGTARWLIVQMLGETKPAGPPRLLDWEGVIATPAGAEAGVATVRLYAPDGTLAFADGGAATPAKLDRLLAAIDGVLAGLATPQASAAPTTPATSGAE